MSQEVSGIHNKNRPTKIEQVIGQPHIVKPLSELFQKPLIDFPHVFLFMGPHGTGKTTLSRIIASYLECNDIIEIDAGQDTGINNIRELDTAIQYKAFGVNPIKVIIIDEAHSLSDASFKALLKILEEPPSHVYWCLCTTEGSKIPKEIKSRCYGLGFNLKPVGTDDIIDLLYDVAKKENFKVSDKVIGLVARESKGSVRDALQLLAKVQDVTSVEEAVDLIDSVEDNPQVIELCRLIASTKTHTDIVTANKILKKLKETHNADNIRQYIANYLSICVLNSTNKDKAANFLMLLNYFTEPIPKQVGFAGLVMKVGEAILST